MGQKGPRNVVCGLIYVLVYNAAGYNAQDQPRDCSAGATVDIVHPAAGQLMVAEWQDVLIARIRCFESPRDGTVSVYLDDKAAAHLDSWTGNPLFLPVLPPGEHSIAIVLLDHVKEFVAECEIVVSYPDRSSDPPVRLPVFDFPAGFPRDVIAKASLPPSSPCDGVLTVIWTCPDWEMDWIAELLDGAGVNFKIIRDSSFEYFACDALVVVSQNDERNRDPDVLAGYLLQFRAMGFKIGVFHLSDEDYTALTYFYPWVHYIIRNHHSSAVAALSNVLDVPLGYKRGFWTGETAHNLTVREAFVDSVQERQFLWNFVGQQQDKPTRIAMIEAAKRAQGGYLKLTSLWDDPDGLSTDEFREVLLHSQFTLCPRGFVHPESFRLWEALESGSVPIVEDDGYFDALLGRDHPLPALTQPRDCPRPVTTHHHTPPHPLPACVDVWAEQLERVLGELDVQFEAVQVYARHPL